MDRKDRPQGREKKVGTGTGRVNKRPASAPVSRPASSSSPSGASGRGSQDKDLGSALGSILSNVADNSSSSNNGSLLGELVGGAVASSGKKKKSSLKTILTIALVVLGIVLLWKYVLKPMFASPASSPEITNSYISVGDTSGDSGAYDVDRTVAAAARDKYTVLRGGGNDTVTIMVYMCATDLESNYGMASSDLQEMLNADISDKINLIVMTGGCSKWNNNVVSSETTQLYKVTSEGLMLLDDDYGRRAMVDPDTLAGFIGYCGENYPADRYDLILWDHGGGTVSGYGYDELYASSGSMTLDKISEALKKGGVKFDFIGFDACLMATLETAMTVEPYADYLIASEETEPGYGWYYTGWLDELSSNTSAETIDIGKKIVDDFIVTSAKQTPSDGTTLSLIDLSELKGTVPAPFTAFASSANALLDGNEYERISNARVSSREFAKSSQINQIDLIHFAKNLGTAESEALISALEGCIKYNRHSASMSNSYGVSVFFPYDNLNQMTSLLKTYKKIEMDSEYTVCVRSFASVCTGGQVVSSSSGSALGSLISGFTGSGSSSNSSDVLSALLSSFLSGDTAESFGFTDGIDWIDADRVRESVSYYSDNYFSEDSLKITEKDGKNVIALSDADWELIQTIELNIFLDDGEGYIDLGLDNVFEHNDDGDLIMDYDGTWLSLDGQIVAYYLLTDERDGDSYTITGYVPAMINGEQSEIYIVFDNETPDGRVIGARTVYEDETDTLGKGIMEIKKGDRIDFICDYYTYDGEYQDSYYLGDTMTFDGEWTIENLSVGDSDCLVTYRFTDIYDNKYWTPSLEYK